MNKNGFSVSRRWFIGGAASALAGCRLGGWEGDCGTSAPLARLGVLSDVHLRVLGDEAYLLKAFTFFRDNGADGVLVAGDIADKGLVEQFERFADCWFRIFPNDRAPDGRRVERLFVYGNHDIGGWRWAVNQSMFPDDAAKRKHALGFEEVYAKTWERLFHEPFEPVWKKTVKGVDVVGAHWMPDNKFNHTTAFFEKQARNLDPSRPLIYTQHPHPKDTCYGPGAWGHDAGESTAVLSAYPKAVAFSGHSHYTLVDERSVWQGAFTSIGTSSLRYSSLDYLKPENTYGNAYDPEAGNWKKRNEKLMQPLRTQDGKEGMLVDVCADRLVIQRRNFEYDAALGADWTVPLPAAEETPFAYTKRAKKRSAPAFAKGAFVSATITSEAPACAQKTAKGPFVHVTFPGAQVVAACRVFEYEVRACDKDGKTVLSRRVMAPGFHLPANRANLPGECLFLVSEFPAGAQVHFEVRASECFGRPGAPIYSTQVTLPV